MSLRFGGHDFSHLPLDRPLTVADFPDPKENEASRSRTEVIVGYVREQHPTLRQLLAKLAGALPATPSSSKGRPKQVADLIQDWIEEGVADGFNLMPRCCRRRCSTASSSMSFRLLQKRGLFQNGLRRRHAPSAFRPVAAGRALFLTNACTPWNVWCAS